MGKLKVNNLTIAYGETVIVKDLNFEVKDGELVSLLGPSGVGKTSILKAIAGLLTPLSGRIFINGQGVNHLAAEKRDAVMIFQKPLLFPFLNVEKNIGFGLKMGHIEKRMARGKIDKILEMTELEKVRYRKIHQLSGGQQQRVALARGLILKPSVLLLDEPLSNLDQDLRQRMRKLICSLQERTGTTMLFVTHDQGEALRISSRIGLLLDGKLQQFGKPEDLFHRPQSIEIAAFFGSDNFICGQIKNNIFTSTVTKLPIDTPDTTTALAVIRPEDIILSTTPTTGYITAVVTKIHFAGSNTKVYVRLHNTDFVIHTVRPALNVGQTVWLHFPAERIHIFP